MITRRDFLLKMVVDFRRAYALVLEGWLGL